MAKFVLFCLTFIAIGVYTIFCGSSAIKNQRLSNSLKSALVTGITKVEGEKAVRSGKILIVMGMIIAVIAASILIIGSGLWILFFVL